MKNSKMIKSFNYAIEGVVHVAITQRNFRIHLAAATIALAAGLLLRVSKFEFMILMLGITFVLVAELMNTAIEATIDVVTTTHDPLAKIAKDVAAAAVLISSVNAVFIGYLLFFDNINSFSLPLILAVQQSPIHLTVVAIFITVVAVVIAKAVYHDHSYLQGGMPSGHTAVAFSIFTAITLVSSDLLIATLGLLLALIVLHSRIERGIHTWFQVVSGAALGILVTILIFKYFGLYF